MSTSLTAIIPVGNLKRDEQNLTEIILLQRKYRFKLVIVFDCQESKDISLFIQHNGNVFDDEITLIQANYGNPGQTRQLGMASVTTEWVCFWDSDDKPEVENILSEIGQLPRTINICIGGFTVSNDVKRTEKRFKFDVSKPRENQRSLARNPGLWRFLFRSDYVRNFEFTNLLMAEDQLYIAEILKNGESIEYAETNFYFYNSVSAGSLTKNNLARLDLFRAAELFEQIIHKAKVENLAILRRMYLNILISSIKYLPMKMRVTSIYKLFLFAFKEFAVSLRRSGA